MAETLHKSDLKDKNGENNGRKAGIDRWAQYFEQGIFRNSGFDKFGRTAHECSLWIFEYYVQDFRGGAAGLTDGCI